MDEFISRGRGGRTRGGDPLGTDSDSRRPDGNALDTIEGGARFYSSRSVSRRWWIGVRFLQGTGKISEAFTLSSSRPLCPTLHIPVFTPLAIWKSVKHREHQNTIARTTMIIMMIIITVMIIVINSHCYYCPDYAKMAGLTWTLSLPPPPPSPPPPPPLSLSLSLSPFFFSLRRCRPLLLLLRVHTGRPTVDKASRWPNRVPARPPPPPPPPPLSALVRQFHFQCTNIIILLYLYTFCLSFFFLSSSLRLCFLSILLKGLVSLLLPASPP